ncbi:hypothetical protein, partial [Halocola ammonii]
MKQLLLLFFILTPFALFAQTFEWGQSYGLGSGNTSFNDRISNVEYSNVLNRALIAGHFYESTDIAIGAESIILTQETESAQGFVVVYESDGNVWFHMKIGSFINKVKFLNDSIFMVAGRFKGSFDFDRTGEAELILTSESIIGDGFLGLYNIDGSPVWIKQFVPGFIGGPTDFEFSGDNVIVSLAAQDGLTFDPLGENISYSTSNTSGGIIMALNFETGNLEWDQVFNTAATQGVSKAHFFPFNDKFLLAIRSDQTSNLDIGIDESTLINIEHETGLVVPFYSSENLNLINYFVIEGNESTSFSSYTLNDYGELLITLTTDDESLIYTDLDSNEFDIDLSEGEDNKTVVLKFNRDLKLSLVYYNQHVSGYSLYDAQIKASNDIYLYGRFDESMSTDQNTYTTSTNDNIYVQRIKANSESDWASFISNESGEITGTEFYVSENQELFLGGNYQSNPNFIFANEDGNQTLGSNAAEEGFFCKYNLGELAEQEAQVYLQTPYFDSIPEGETLNSHLFISKLPAESVEVTLTPDDQLDLGNGQGVPVVFTFDDSEPLSDQMFDVSITAFDDEAVEGEFHTGMIQIDVSSADPEFDAIESFSEELILIDDDVDSVDERNKDSQISVYP